VGGIPLFTLAAIQELDVFVSKYGEDNGFGLKVAKEGPRAGNNGSRSAEIVIGSGQWA
jgi:hypothetical protein